MCVMVAYRRGERHCGLERVRFCATGALTVPNSLKGSQDFGDL